MSGTSRLIAKKPEEWLKVSKNGLFVVPGNFFVDPNTASDMAVITHAHADHARSGHKRVISTPETLAIMKVRFGEAFSPSPYGLKYGKKLKINDVIIWLAPAGHVLGSAQIVIEYKGSRVVVSGDYKRQADSTCRPFEVVNCDVFITEATFGLPVFKHPKAQTETKKLLNSIDLFNNRCHVVGTYALGKAQRVISLLRESGYHQPIFIHGALRKLCDLYVEHGIDLGELRPVPDSRKKPGVLDLEGQIVLAPPSAIADRWVRKLGNPVIVMASGWMRIKQRARQRNVDLPLVISDHADWDELFQTFHEVAAPEIWVTHGREEAIIHQAKLEGFKAKALSLIGYDEEST